jgi:ribosomal protein S18 acetylase RimI-like enzyme
VSYKLDATAIPIRPIRETDALSFRAALDAVCRERRYLARAEAPPIEKVRAFVEGNIRAGIPQFVAEDGGAVVGWCDAIPDARFGHTHVAVLGMGVLAAYRGRKIGFHLLEAVIAATRRRQIEKIELVVRASNQPALALYRKVGFQTEGTKQRGILVDGQYDDLVLMGLFLR